MITNVCLLLEILSIIFCIHYLYGEKFRLDIATTSYLAIHMIIMTSMNYYELPPIYSMSTYIIMFIYCGIRFGLNLKAMVINNILYIVIIGVMQIIITMCYGYIFNILVFNDVELLIFNCIVFCGVLLILPKMKVNKLSTYLQDKERILIISLVLCVIFAASSVINYKMLKVAELYQYMPLFVCIAMIFILASQLNKFKIISKMTETELKTHQVYADSFRNIIEEIRSRQHEFDNQINMIYSQHYMYHTYEELVYAQKEHCELVLKENRYNKLLTLGNHVVIGFLYGKFIEIDKYGIDILYKIDIEKLEIGVPVYKLVEILGNLVDNAREALELLDDNKRLYVSVIEINSKFEIEVRNRSEFITPDEIDIFFKKGVSKKGSGRGLGLYNVKSICDEYLLNIYCNNKSINNENWLTFVINNKR